MLLCTILETPFSYENSEIPKMLYIMNEILKYFSFRQPLY